jgi:hypothetical protein
MEKPQIELSGRERYMVLKGEKKLHLLLYPFKDAARIIDFASFRPIALTLAILLICSYFFLIMEARKVFVRMVFLELTILVRI